jgi:hypothetical protein
MAGPWLQVGREAESSGPAMDWSSMPPGSLFISDSGYFSYQRMTTLEAQGNWWLTSAKADLRFYDEQGELWTLPDYLCTQRQQPIIDTWIQVGITARVRCRLVVMRAGKEAAEKRRQHRYVRTHMPQDRKGAHRLGPKAAKGTLPRRKSTKSRQKHNSMSAGRLKLSEWTILLTNVPDELLEAEEVLVLMRVRWQHELLWRLWKHYGKIDSWRSEKAMRIETEIYAKLVVALIEHWQALLGCWADPRHSLVRAKKMSQWAASALCLGLMGEMELGRVLEIITGAMKGGCRIDTRRKKPNTNQLLANSKLIRPLG